MERYQIGDEWNDGFEGSKCFVQEFLELGEDSLEFSAAEDEMRKLQKQVNEAEMRERGLCQEMQHKQQQLSKYEDVVERLKTELMEERLRAKDEAEDMAQEIAELRFQMNEMLEEERQLRARTENLCVQRVEELESQLAKARQKEAELQAEKGNQEMRSALKEVGENFQKTNLQQEPGKEDSHNVEAEWELDPKVDRVVKEISRLLKNKEESGEDEIDFMDRMLEEAQEAETKLRCERDMLALKLAELEEQLHARSTQTSLVVENAEEPEISESRTDDKRVWELERRVEELEAELRESSSEFELRSVELENRLSEAAEKLVALELELEISKREAETLQRVLELTENQIAESIQEGEALRGTVRELSRVVESREQELAYERVATSRLVRQIGEVTSEVMILRQKLIVCQTQVSELAMKTVILEGTISDKDIMIEECKERIVEEEDKYFVLQSKLSALQSDFGALEVKLRESRRKEYELRCQVERTSVELAMAKEEVVNSEVRLQKVTKHAKEEVEAEKYKHQETVDLHRRAEWLLGKQTENLKTLEMEKEQLQMDLTKWIKSR